MHPAPVDHGIKFKRRDLPDEPTIDARIDNVKTVERATTIGEGAVKVHTVEHVLARSGGRWAWTMPSSRWMRTSRRSATAARSLMWSLIKKAGIAAQEAPRQFFDVSEPIHLETKTGVADDRRCRMRNSAFPARKWGRTVAFTQYLSTEITPAIYEREIAPARTFVFYEDVKPLMDKDLIKGGSLENAVVVRGEAVLSKEPLRFATNSCGTRSSISSAISRCSGGASAGMSSPSSRATAEYGSGARARRSKREGARWSCPACLPPSDGGSRHQRRDEASAASLSVSDGGSDCRLRRRDEMYGMKSVTINEPFFQGHFPGHPVMPGVLQVEAMAQVASILMIQLAKSASRIGYFMSADDVKFRKPVVPGDTLFIEVEMTQERGERLPKREAVAW